MKHQQLVMARILEKVYMRDSRTFASLATGGRSSLEKCECMAKVVKRKIDIRCCQRRHSNGGGEYEAKKNLQLVHLGGLIG